VNAACGYLVGNMVVAANLKSQADAEAAAKASDDAWPQLESQASAMGLELRLCHLSPGCDGGDCGCGPGLFDSSGALVLSPRNSDLVDDLEIARDLLRQMEVRKS
jgi:hypothetical protein